VNIASLQEGDKNPNALATSLLTLYKHKNNHFLGDSEPYYGRLTRRRIS
jgi:hypothetical protein